jgi:glycosyltransferase involved in cell wall biosynthesis
VSYKRPPQWWRYSNLLETAVRNVDAFLAPSQFSEEIHAAMDLDIPIVRLPLFVPMPDGDTESPDAADKKGVTPYFLFVGRLEHLKGLHTLIPLFRAYRKAQLVIAGTGAEEHALQRLAAESPNIRFVGQVTGAELQSLYRNAVAVIVPSISFEVFPLVVLEAFSHRTPVVVRALGGMTEAVVQSQGGYTYENDGQLLEAIDELVEQPEKRTLLGMRGFEAYRDNWSPDAYFSRYLGLIDEINARRLGRAS